MGILCFSSMKGLGDNIYQRAYIKKLSNHIVYLDTPWPQLYDDLPFVNFVRSNTTLRTQAKNVLRSPYIKYTNWPTGHRHKPVSYPTGQILTGMTYVFGTRPSTFDLPAFVSPRVPLKSNGNGKYVIVRPVTIRKEWIADARNPDPEYVNYCAKKMGEMGYTVISIADLIPGVEWLVGPEPYADVKFHKGELTVTDMLGLTKNASAVIGGIGWIVPACVACNVPAFIICGGQGGYNAPSNITDGTMHDLSKMDFAVPDNFCMCKQASHNCDKRISNLPTLFESWLKRMNLE